jgi:hypothetical protein
MASPWLGGKEKAGGAGCRWKRRKGGGGMEGWKDGRTARKGREPWEGRGSRAGAWVFYEVKSVVR